MISEFLSVDLCNFIDQIILLCNFNSSTLYPEKVNILCYTTILCYIYQHLSCINTWSFEHSGDISCSLLVNPSHSDESWAGQNTCLWIYTLWIYSLSTLENTDENKLFCLFTTSILAKLNTWCFEHSGDISCFLLVNLSHTDESWAGRITRLWIYIYIYIYIYI